jgi:hypothetical protein
MQKKDISESARATERRGRREGGGGGICARARERERERERREESKGMHIIKTTQRDPL